MTVGENNIISVVPFIEEINVDQLKAKCSSWQQFSILFRRSSKQIYRNKVTFRKFKVNFYYFCELYIFISELFIIENVHAHILGLCDRWPILPDGK